MPRDAATSAGAPAGSPHAGAAPARELRARGQRTQRRLLDAGADVFARRGYHAARVDDIVKLAKTSHGTFYLYFENKEDLFAALAAEVGDRMTELFDALPAFGPGPDGCAELEGWLTRFGELYRSAGPILRAWTEAEIAGDSVGRLGADAMRRFTAVIGERFRAAATPGVDPALAALAIVAMIERAHYYALTDQTPARPEHLAATLARVTHAAVHAP